MVIHIFIFMQTCLSCKHYNDNKWKLFPKWERCHSEIVCWQPNWSILSAAEIPFFISKVGIWRGAFT